MPRIYAVNEAHDMAWGYVDFANGVSALPAGSNTAYWLGEGYGVDTSKHETTVLDELTPAQLRGLCAYLGITIDQGEDPDTKQVLVRAIESSLSTKYLDTVTVVSAAGATTGKTAITITGEGTYKYKTGTAALTPYFMDDVSDWTTIVTGVEFTPVEGATHITVAKIDSEGHVLGLGSDEITVKTT